MVYGINRTADPPPVKEKWRVPFSNTPVGREIQMIYCIVTIKMCHPTEYRNFIPPVL